MTDRTDFLSALNRNLTDSTALSGSLPVNLRSAASVYSQSQVDSLLANYYTSAQTETLLNDKAAKGANSDITSLSGLTTPLSTAQGGTGVASITASRALVSDGDGKIATSAATATEVGYLSGVTSAIQTQLGDKAPLASPTFTGTPAVPTAAQGTNTTQAASTAFVVAEIAASGGGSGDVVGPASSTNNNFAQFDGTTGKLLEDSGVSASSFQTADTTLTALAAYNTNGLLTQTAADTFAGRTITGTSNEIDVSNGNGVSGNPTLSLPTVAKAYGKQAIPVPAGAMKATTTNGAASGTAEMTTNKNMVVTLDFDASTQEFAQFSIPMPKSWNESTITFVPHWSHASTTTNFGVVWQLQAVAVSNDDALDVAFGTAQTSTDTGGTTNDYYAGPESSAITIAGTPAENDLVMFQVARVPANGSDTMAIDARLHGITLYITTNAGNDA